VDTRSKILETAPSSFRRPLLLVTGYFDVLRAEHARRLRQAREDAGASTVMVIVRRRAGELLSQRARAEMVAALRGVDYVALGELPGVQPDSILHLEDEHERQSAELRALVLERISVGK
jgi:glycerol-3-phosphate cytidylyltransferase-like family protein